MVQYFLLPHPFLLSRICLSFPLHEGPGVEREDFICSSIVQYQTPLFGECAKSACTFILAYDLRSKNFRNFRRLITILCSVESQ